MAITSISQLKEWFRSGKYPTGQQFASLMDSFIHKSDSIRVDNVKNLPEFLNEKFDKKQGDSLRREHDVLQRAFDLFKAAGDLTEFYKKTDTYSKKEVNEKLSAIPKISYKAVDALPSNPAEKVIYVLQHGENWTENMFTDGKWITLATHTGIYGNLENKVAGLAQEIVGINHPLSFTQGYVKNTGDLVTTSGVYRFSQLLPVKTGDTVRYKACGSENTLALAAYSGNTCIVAKSIVGNSQIVEATYTVPAGIDGIRLTIHTGSVTEDEAYVRIEGIQAAVGKMEGSLVKNTTDISALARELRGIVYTIDAFALREQRVYVKDKAVHSGDKGWVSFRLTGIPDGTKSVALHYNSQSSATYAISAWDKNNNFLDGVVMTEGNRQTAELTLPKDTAYIIATSTVTGTTDDNDVRLRMIGSSASLTERVNSLQKQVDKGVSASTPRNYLFMKNRNSINFTFDDSTSQDSDIKKVFDEFNVKCGFAIITASERYRNFHNEGFELLAHGIGAFSADTITEDAVRTAMQKGKSVVESLGVECHGWVTPSSQLKSNFQPVVCDYFDYGYTIYKGNDTTGQTIPKTAKSYQLWRIHIATLLKDYQRIIGEAVSENGALAVYGHGYEIGNLWTLDQLRTLLSYCKGKIEVLTPSESFLKLFSVRHNERL